MPENLSGQFAGLPLGLLVCTPIIEVAKGQSELCRVYLDYVYRLAFIDGDPTKGTKTLTFNLTRPVTDGSGNISQQQVQVVAPLISLVPVPAFTMDEATVRFTMEVKEQTVDRNHTGTESKVDSGMSFWGFHAQISGSVTTSAEHTRQSDQSAKYEIYARAAQQAPADGMAKLSAVFASVIEPIAVGSGGGGSGS